MGKNSQRRRTVNGNDPGPIEKAIDKAAEQRAPLEKTVVLDRSPIRLAKNGRQAIKARANPNEASLLIRLADGVWHGVILPPGSTFELRPVESAQLWTPPK